MKQVSAELNELKKETFLRTTGTPRMIPLRSNYFDKTGGSAASTERENKTHNSTTSLYNEQFIFFLS